MKLSPNFSLDELTRSDYASRHGLENEPDAKTIENLTKLDLPAGVDIEIKL